MDIQLRIYEKCVRWKSDEIENDMGKPHPYTDKFLKCPIYQTDSVTPTDSITEIESTNSSKFKETGTKE